MTDYTFEAIFRLSPDPMLLISRYEGRIISVNPAFCSCTGSSAASFIGNHLRNVFNDGWEDLLTEPFTRQKADLITGKTAFFECSSTRMGSRVFVIARDVTAATEKHEDLYWRAHYDSVTSLPNRVLFEDMAKQGLIQAEREGRPAAIVFIDMDNFKQINDTYGHKVGDAVLQETATRLLGATRGTDTVTRLGGDEFAIFLSMLKDSKRVETILERLHKTMEYPIDSGPEQIDVTFSFGVSIFPEDGRNMEDLLSRADDRMYEQKAVKRGYSYARSTR